MASGYPTTIRNDFSRKDALTQLDLSIMAYHLYCQTLLWPLDPWYETTGSEDHRDQIMAAVRHTTKNAYLMPEVRGPGLAMGFQDDGGRLEPVLSTYSKRLRPWATGYQYEGDKFAVFEPNPAFGPHVIKTSYCQYTQDPSNDLLTKAPHKMLDYVSDPKDDVTFNPNPAPGAKDEIIAFEGGHGILPDGNTALWSMMGFVYKQYIDDSNYRVHIVFRGSRSGSNVGRTVNNAKAGKGNADWITDLNNNALSRRSKLDFVSKRGSVGAAFGRSLISGMPTLLKSLKAIAKSSAKKPQDIFITGHSLGGGLATLLAYSLKAGYFKEAVSKINKLKDWNWGQTQTYTFSAPCALSPNSGKIFESRAKGIKLWRIKVAGDPITTFKFRMVHVGKKISLSGGRFSLPDTARHETMAVRKSLMKTFFKNAFPRTGFTRTPMRYVEDGQNYIPPIRDLPNAKIAILFLRNVQLVMKGSRVGMNDDPNPVDNWKDLKAAIAQEEDALKDAPTALKLKKDGSFRAEGKSRWYRRKRRADKFQEMEEVKDEEEIEILEESGEVEDQGEQSNSKLEGLEPHLAKFREYWTS